MAWMSGWGGTGVMEIPTITKYGRRYVITCVNMNTLLLVIWRNQNAPIQANLGSRDQIKINQYPSTCLIWLLPDVVFTTVPKIPDKSWRKSEFNPKRWKTISVAFCVFFDYTTRFQATQCTVYIAVLLCCTSQLLWDYIDTEKNKSPAQGYHFDVPDGQIERLRNRFVNATISIWN
jgi:hypothetical protein